MDLICTVKIMYKLYSFFFISEDSEPSLVTLVGKTRGEQKLNRLLQVFQEYEANAEADSQKSAIENEIAGYKLNAKPTPDICLWKKGEYFCPCFAEGNKVVFCITAFLTDS